MLLFDSRPLASLLTQAALARAAYDIGYHNDDDLTRFVTRPEIKAPVFEVSIHHPDDLTPGYWFIAPYAHIVQQSHASNYYQPCQTGPAIYDARGNLVWSGACLTSNQNTCDFRAFVANDSVYMSAILTLYPAKDSVGKGIVLDNSMQVIKEVFTPNDMGPFNMHEFLVHDGGRRAIHIIQKTGLKDTEHLGAGDTKAGLVVDVGFRELNLHTGQTTFIWWASQHINLNASTYPARNLHGPYPNGWDWIHLNAIDRNVDGDYLVTARYTDAVYKVSGSDGHIMWSLGGTNSSFKLNGFNFSRLHDARFVSSDAGSETISLLDNGGCEESRSSDVSSALVIRLDRTSDEWTASVENRWTRPDGGRSDKRGNFQLLPSGNAFIGWSENSYISEHAPDGRVLMEAQFVSQRFVTYRAYKFNFTSAPAEPPMLKGFVYGVNRSQSVSVYYVSWNGATEVASWDFYSENGILLGSAPKTGFETTFQQASHCFDKAFAQAISADGVVLGKTEVEQMKLPDTWLEAEQALRELSEVMDKDESIRTEL